MAGRNKIGSLLVALLAFFALSGTALALFGEYEDEQPVERTYVPAPAAVRGETPEQADARSAGCLSCHTASDEPTMHRSASRSSTGSPPHHVVSTPATVG